MEHDNFAESVKKYRKTVFRIAVNYVKNAYDADDITQNVFLKLYSKNSQFVSDRRFPSDEAEKAWLIRVAVNEAKNFLKSAWKRNRSDLEDFQNIPAPESESMGLRDYVNSLKPKYRIVIYLYYYERYSVNEIAGILKISKSAVTTQLSRAREQLKEMFTEEEYTHGKELRSNI